MQIYTSEADIMKEHDFNNKPQVQLGGISNAVAKQLTVENRQNQINYTKIIREFERLNEVQKKKDEDDEQSEDDEIALQPEKEFGADEFNPGAKDQNKNKSIFRKKYGVEKALPC